MRPEPTMVEPLAAIAHPLTGAADDYDPVIETIGTATIVLLGEATHGTHEFYRHRAEITKRLIEEKGFNAVAIEGDWPEAERVARFVLNRSSDPDARTALSGFRHFPAWMWRNTVVLEFVAWLRSHNLAIPRGGHGVGFWGLDLYSLHSSMKAVVDYLDRADPAAARRARARYACFDHFGEDPQAYGKVAAFDLSRSCEDEVVDQLVELQREAARYAADDGEVGVLEQFLAERNAQLVRDAEEYYRSMFRGRVSTWNMRDRHMAATLEALFDHLERTEGTAKVVVWEHNSHLGDARATSMGAEGELNVGQLARERYGRAVVSIGFTTYDGTVTAASGWGGPAERKVVRPALEGSYEDLLHRTRIAEFFLDLGRASEIAPELGRARLERAIGVVYLPRTERVSHYFLAALPLQFDAVIHVDRTRALEPLERSAAWERGELFETFPTGM